MRNLLALGAAALLGFAGIGWYLGWYTIETNKTSSGRDVNIHLNTPKIKEDVGKGEQKLHDYLNQDTSASNPSPSNAAPVTPTGFHPPSSATNNPPFTPVPPGGATQSLPPPR